MKSALLCALPLLSSLNVLSHPASAAPRQPNIIYILCDDLGYGDFGVFFQNQRAKTRAPGEPWHSTPNLDAFAAQGVQLPNNYCPAPVCAPSRASFLAGVTQGHANVRDNQFDKALENNHTVASVLKSAGYATAAIGKWGLQGKNIGPGDWVAHPQHRGFDDYFGTIRHQDGHFHYPKEDGKEVWDGHREVSAQLDKCYTADLFTARAKKWIADQRAATPEKPFFLYLAYDTPHAKLQLPPCPYPKGGGLTGGVQWTGKAGQMLNTAIGEVDSYTHPDYANALWDDDNLPATPDVPWPDVYQRYATDVRRIDDNVGDLMQQLKDLKIDDNTLVVFTTDNGPSRESYLPENYEPTFFNSFGPFDGIKRDLWEGGTRAGALARWPGTIPANRVDQTPGGAWDWLATFAAAAKAPIPARSDGVSLLPAMTGRGVQKPSTVYIEYFEGGRTPNYNEFAPDHRQRVRQQMQSIRFGDFIGVRYDVKAANDDFEIYQIARDPQETRNLAAQMNGLQQQMKDRVLQVRRPNASAKRPYDDALIPAARNLKTAPGVNWKAYRGAFGYVPELTALTPFVQGMTINVNDLPRIASTGNALLLSGYIEAPADGEYSFTLKSGSGAFLRLHEAQLIDADFGYKPGSEITATIQLKAGKHPFRLYSAQTQGDAKANLQTVLQWSGPGFAKQVVPDSAFSRD